MGWRFEVCKCPAVRVLWHPVSAEECYTLAYMQARSLSRQAHEQSLQLSTPISSVTGCAGNSSWQLSLFAWVQEANGGAGVYSADMRKRWQLEDDSWKYDIMPEIMDGRNVADFVDPDIEAQLAQLEKEEDALSAAAALEVCLDIPT